GSNITAQVRHIAAVTTAVANGGLSKKITVDVYGEILELKRTTNPMVNQLGSFAAEVTRVAREVGTEGQLGAQAEVKGVAGVWKEIGGESSRVGGKMSVQDRNVAKGTTAVAESSQSKSYKGDV